MPRKSAEEKRRRANQDWTDLLTNIWNTTPQPDRGGPTALELLKPERRPKRR